MPGFTIQPIDTQTLTDAEWQAICDLLNPYRLEIEPAFTPIDVAEARRRYLPREDFYRNDYWWARTPAGTPVGWLEVGRFVETDHNQHSLNMEIVVAAPWRRQGVGSALLAQTVTVAKAEGRRLIDSFANSRIPAGEAFLLRIGGKIGMRHVSNELLLADVDRALLQTWIDRAPERAADYELAEIPSPYAAKMLEPLAGLLRLMNTAPLEDLEAEDILWTADQVRQMDASLHKRGGRRFTLAVRHRPSGDLVGYTDIIQYGFQQQFLWQEDTAVAPEHRNRGLGRWLKAANLLRVTEACPEATRVRTGNAGSNAPMLAINHEMGFREIFANAIIQVPLDGAQAYLTERGPLSPLPRLGGDG